jgi:hypothetical protein
MRGLEHLWRVLPCEAYVLPLLPAAIDVLDEGNWLARSGYGGTMTDSISSTVKYHAYLRKMTRYNPTRGGMISIPASQLSVCARKTRLTHSRSFPFPCSVKNLLQDRPWHDSPQDRPWCRCYGETQGFRGCPTAI